MVNTHRSISTSALDETVIDDLQRQLSAKNDLLTETRLEALSSASQMQALREQVAKLRSELRYVRTRHVFAKPPECHILASIW